MTQKLSELVRDGFTYWHFPPIKTKAEVRRAASQKAWRTRKRQAKAREAAALETQERDAA